MNRVLGWLDATLRIADFRESRLTTSPSEYFFSNYAKWPAVRKTPPPRAPGTERPSSCPRCRNRSKPRVRISTCTSDLFGRDCQEIALTLGGTSRSVCYWRLEVIPELGTRNMSTDKQTSTYVNLVAYLLRRGYTATLYA